MRVQGMAIPAGLLLLRFDKACPMLVLVEVIGKCMSTGRFVCGQRESWQDAEPGRGSRSLWNHRRSTAAGPGVKDLNMLSDPIYRLRSLFRRKKAEQELDDELQFHLACETAKLVQRGLSPAEATRRARLALGGPEQVKEHVRDARGTRWLEDVAQDVRYAVRTSAKNPGFTLTVVATLALGIGATTALFSVANAVLLRWLPVANPRELVVLARDPNQPYVPHSRPDYLRLRDHAGASFQGVAASHESGTAGFSMDQRGHSGATVVVNLAYVSGTYFGVLGVEPAAGRLLAKEDEAAPGANPYVVLDYGFWQRELGGDPGVLGRTVRLNHALCSVVGIARPDFHGTQVGNLPDVYAALTLYPSLVPSMRNNWDRPGRQWLTITARLRSGVTVAQAEAQVTSLLGDRAAEFGRSAMSSGPGDGGDRSWKPTLLPGAQGYSPLQTLYGKPLIVLLAAAGLLLLLACANVAGLVLARAGSRQREIAMRLAVGASRGRVVRQLLTENLVLAALGGLVGIALGAGGARLLVNLLPMEMASVKLDASPDPSMLAASFVVTVLSGLLFGLAPALRSSRQDLTEALKRSTGGFGRLRGGLPARAILVVAQVSLCLVLLVGVALLARSFAHLQAIDPGFAQDGVLLVQVQPTQNGYEGPRARAFYEQLRQRVAALPGVRAAGLSEETPLGGGNSGGTASAPGRPGMGAVEAYGVSASYLAAMGIPLISGRYFSPEDETPGAPPVCLVTRSLAQRLCPGENPIGRRLSREQQYDSRQSFEIVGVVGDARYFGLRTQPVPTVYLPVQPAASRLALVVRTAGPSESVIPAVRRETAAIDPGVPVLMAQTMRHRLEQEVAQERLLSTLVSGFGTLALVLVAVGLYGVLALSVTSRTKEIGIRVALGARRANIIGPVLMETARMVGGGAAVGLLAAVSCVHLLARFLYGVPPFDAPSFLIASGVLSVVALVASGVPARRAAQVNPVVALRND